LIKPEWGVKRQCTKCNTRFYDLEKADPVTCINCGNAWVPEPVLKSKAPMYETAKPVAVAEVADNAELEAEGIELDEATEPAEDDTDIGGDDELAEVVDPASEQEV